MLVLVFHKPRLFYYNTLYYYHGLVDPDEPSKAALGRAASAAGGAIIPNIMGAGVAGTGLLTLREPM